MDIVIFIILFISFVVLGWMWMLSNQIAEIRLLLKSGTPTETGNYDELEEEPMDSIDMERLEKQRAFDDRISRIKDELAKKQPQHRNGYEADILHPDIQNLDHTDLRTDRTPDVEYAE